MKSFLFLPFLSVFVIPFSSFSQSTPILNERQVVQKQRIEEGCSSGELSRKESVRLEIQQRNIQQKKRMAKADGVVTPAEKIRVHAAQNRASRNIARQKNDGETR